MSTNSSLNVGDTVMIRGLQATVTAVQPGHGTVTVRFVNGGATDTVSLSGVTKK
ncbi:hypothetical protein EXIGLDRAFT_758848 [Exidia glandulosa HHB12029]|uniref:Hypervirulence associated protein TUDOR domain-containing protein n=1 Tax=Exidia glandulosa HHB12029 TaxID=1314781 RepID=A0A165QER6_EXIGL|nr:hypothetical protein EXIGLDRAFT_758848 [Exidia glandulosa HHB12029]